MYALVASTGALTFNLYVYSTPKGATVSYRMRGDVEYQTLDHPTDWRIENLTRAVYEIKLHKQGCTDFESKFNAMEDTRTSIDPTLECKKGPRK